MTNSDQSKYKPLRDKWRLDNPNYAKEYYLLVKNTPEFKEKARIRAKNGEITIKKKKKIFTQNGKKIIKRQSIE